MDTHPTIERWRDELKTPDWLFAATKAGKGWAAGKELSRDEYEAALAEVSDAQILASAPAPKAAVPSDQAADTNKPLAFNR